MKKSLRMILLLFIAIVIGCEKSENKLPLEGTWIEIAAKSDTIKFSRFGSSAALELSRGLELRNGYWLPKYGAGIYNYELKNDTIALHSLYSSSMSYKKYYFKWKTHNTFEIGNFYNQTISSNQLITFSKIE